MVQSCVNALNACRCDPYQLDSPVPGITESLHIALLLQPGHNPRRRRLRHVENLLQLLQRILSLRGLLQLYQDLQLCQRQILYDLLADYGVEANEGIVVEGDREHYSFQGPAVLLPDMSSDTITDSLIDENYYPIMPISLGLTVTENDRGGTVTELLTTSYTSYSKLAGYNITDYEQEDGDIDGPFALAVSIDTAGEGKIVWFTSSYFLDDMYNATSSGANANLGMNALSSLIGETEAMAIRSKSLNYNYLTISEFTASLLKVTMIGVFPLLYLGIGIWVVLRRRRLQNEPV